LLKDLKQNISGCHYGPASVKLYAIHTQFHFQLQLQLQSRDPDPCRQTSGMAL